MMDKQKIYPRSKDRETVYLKNVVTDPSIIVGDYTMYNDFVIDPVDFQNHESGGKKEDIGECSRIVFFISFSLALFSFFLLLLLDFSFLFILIYCGPFCIVSSCFLFCNKSFCNFFECDSCSIYIIVHPIGRHEKCRQSRLRFDHFGDRRKIRSVHIWDR